MSTQGLEVLRQRIYCDPELALRLRRLDPERFTADVLRFVSETGYDVTERDVAEAVIQAQGAWSLRWIR